MDNDNISVNDIIKKMNELWDEDIPDIAKEDNLMPDHKDFKPWQERIMKHYEKVGLLNNLLTKIYELQAKGWTIEEIAKEVNLPKATVRYYLGEDILNSTYGVAQNDPVNHPSHYTDGKIEVIDFIEDKKLGFHLGNAVKYISRAGKKDPKKEIEDLEKAVWYVQRRIEQLRKAKNIPNALSTSGDTDGDAITTF